MEQKTHVVLEYLSRDERRPRSFYDIQHHAGKSHTVGELVSHLGRLTHKGMVQRIDGSGVPVTYQITNLGVRMLQQKPYRTQPSSLRMWVGAAVLIACAVGIYFALL